MATTPKQPQLAGVVGFFDDAHALTDAMRKIRDANYQTFDAFTPFPVHGLDDAMGIKRSVLPYITFGAGVTGALFGFGMQYWTSAVDWAVNVGGKPFNSWPAFVPVMFETTVLFAGLATLGGMLALNRLPNTKRKIFDPSITRDQFCAFIGAPEPMDPEHDDVEEIQKARSKFKAYDTAEAQKLLQSLGAKNVRTVNYEPWF